MSLDIETARGWYQAHDTVHDFEHVLRVLAMALRIARAEGADLEIVRAAALLHDAVGAQESGSGTRLGHHLASAEFAASVLSAEAWSPERIQAVQHAIRAHRFRHTGERPQTLEAQCLFDADKLDVLGAIGVARTIAYAALAGQPAYAKPSERFLATGEHEADEPHSSYHEYLFKLRRVAGMLFTPTGRAIGEKRAAFLNIFYKNLAEESQDL